MRKLLTDDTLFNAIKRIENGESIAAIARDLDVSPSGISRNIKAKFPVQHAELVRKGALRVGRRTLVEIDPQAVEAARSHPAVQAIMAGDTYDAALEANPDLTRGRLQRMVGLLRKYDGIEPMYTVRRRKSRKDKGVPRQLTTST